MPAPRPSVFRRAARLAGVLACLGVPLAASAYVRTRSPDHKNEPLWSDARITMTLRTAGTQVVSLEDFQSAATRAAAAWSAPALDTSVAITIDASTDAPPGTRYDHVNTISFRTDGWTPPVYPDSALALTTVWSQGARIVDADTELNAAEARFQWGVLSDDPAVAALASEVDLQNALTHELGHVLGLAHPCVLGDPSRQPELDDQGQPVLSCSDPALPAAVFAATMFPASVSGSIAERTLSPDEVKALHDLYPAGVPPPVTAPDLGSRSGGCALEAGPPSSLGLAALVLATALARRRRQAGP